MSQQQKLNQLLQAEKAARASLRQVNAELSERKAYFDQQEQAIAEAMEQGNALLVSLNYEITIAKQQVKDLKNDLRTLKTDKQLLTEDVERLQDQAVRLDPSLGYAI